MPFEEGIEHLHLFFYNKGVIGLAWCFLGLTHPEQKLSAIPCCKDSIKQVEAHMSLRVTNQNESQ